MYDCVTGVQIPGFHGCIMADEMVLEIKIPILQIDLQIIGLLFPRKFFLELLNISIYSKYRFMSIIFRLMSISKNAVKFQQVQINNSKNTKIIIIFPFSQLLNRHRFRYFDSTLVFHLDQKRTFKNAQKILNHPVLI